MKKIVLILTALLTLVSCGKQEQEIDKTVTITNSVELNTYDADMRGYKWLYDSEPAFTEITLEESIRIFKEKGSGILYYGYVGCPWCERAVPILNKVAKETGVTVYYLNKNNNYFYYVPVTRMVNDDREKIKIIIDELT